MLNEIFFGGGGVPATTSWPTHQKALEKTLGIMDQSSPMLRLSHKSMR